MASAEEQEYNSLLHEISVLKQEHKITISQRVETLQIFSRFVEAVTSVPEPMFRGPHLAEAVQVVKRRNSAEYSRKEKHRSWPRFTNKKSPLSIPLPSAYMDNFIWGTVFRFLDYLSMCSVCCVCKRFYEVVHSGLVQKFMDEQTCLFSWKKRLESIPKINPWVPSTAELMPLFIIPGFTFKSKDTKQAVKISKEITSELVTERKKLRYTFPLLVIGPPGSGKSTFIRNYLCPGELQGSYLQQIRSFTVEAMKSFLEQNNLLPLKDPPIQEVNLLTIPTIWANQAIRSAFLSSTFSSPPSSFRNAEYFFNKAQHISLDNYSPTDADLRRLHIKEHNSVTEHTSNSGKHTYKIVQVQDIAAHFKLFEVFTTMEITYLCVSLADISKEVCNYVWEIVSRERFAPKNCVVVLTKLDLFNELFLAGKISLSSIFPSYAGGDTNLQAATALISDNFRALTPNIRAVLFINNLDPTPLDVILPFLPNETYCPLI